MPPSLEINTFKPEMVPVLSYLPGRREGNWPKTTQFPQRYVGHLLYANDYGAPWEAESFLRTRRFEQKDLLTTAPTLTQEGF